MAQIDLDAQEQFEGLEQATEVLYTVEAAEPNGGVVFLVVKRVFDIVFSLLAGVIALIPGLVVALIVRLDSEGPVLFSQERLGKNGVPFYIYKFRTMRVDAEADGPQWASANDTRCTRAGVYLRKFHLDELPQILNILKGDMSLVGPRPERAVFYERFETYIHGFRHRLAVKPGLTGMAQVSGGYDLKPEEKIVHDMAYIRKQSLWLDVKILLKTVGIVLLRRGAR